MEEETTQMDWNTRGALLHAGQCQLCTGKRWSDGASSLPIGAVELLLDPRRSGCHRGLGVEQQSTLVQAPGHFSQVDATGDANRLVGVMSQFF